MKFAHSPGTERDWRVDMPELCDLDRPLWVFGYGSLIWNPGFTPSERRVVTLSGYRRALCVWAVHYRGNETYPGLVFGLDPGQWSCQGQVLRVAQADREAVLGYLWDREMIGGVYRPALLPCHGPDGEVLALTFVCNTEHERYAGALSENRITEVVATAQGRCGSNREYVDSTWQSLADLRVSDPELDAIVMRLRQRV